MPDSGSAQPHPGTWRPFHDEIYRTAGAKDASDHGNLAACPQVSMENGRLSVDLPANRGTVIFVKN